MKVSAAIITYNQEKSLAAAVESALMQTVGFDFEVVVADDCSTDGTADVLRKLELQYPEKVRAIYRRPNIGANANLLDTIAACRGDYVAMLEGDDLWTDPRKLQRQADWLDAHPDCSLCCHAVNYVHEDGSRPTERFPRNGKEVSSLEDILTEAANFHTCSFMFRRRLFSPPDWLRSLWIGDWPILALLAEQGGVGFIDEVMSEYHIHPGGVWSNSSRLRRADGLLQVFQHIRRHFGPRYSQQTAWLLASRACDLSRELELAGRRDEARRRLVEAVEVLLEETPEQKTLIDELAKSVVRLGGQSPTAATLDAAALRAEIARRDAQLAAVTKELALLKESRWWRFRQRLVTLPGMGRLMRALRRR